MLTSYQAGLKPVPFQQAILQSPGFQPVPSSNEQEQTFNEFLRIANVSGLEEARQLPTERLIAANAQQIQKSNYGTYSCMTLTTHVTLKSVLITSSDGPTVGGQFAPELPGKLLLEGAFAKDVNVMVGHNIFEGV